jgi:putative transposase
MQATEELGSVVGIKPACEAMNVNRATLYRRRSRETARDKPPSTRVPPLKLSDAERNDVVEVMHGARFVDASPHTIYATLLEEGTYHCSVRTMYRILEQEGEVRERRRVVQRSHYAKPELLATGPNQLWSWDITKLKGPEKWNYFHLYVILDVYSRCVVGWMVADRELATLAETLIQEACARQQIPPDQLTLHADRGSSMKSKLVAQLLADLGVTKTHSRPHVSNDNPFSEAHFKTMKYRPSFPDRFGCIEDARAFCRDFFHWYNTSHRHSGIAFMTPESIHRGNTTAIIKARTNTLHAAFADHPERFKGKRPKPQTPPEAVWINPPSTKDNADQDEPATQA